MKVPTPANMLQPRQQQQQSATTNASKTATKRSTSPENASADDAGAANVATQEGRGFASVLEDLTRAGKHQEDDRNDGERSETKNSERAEPERETPRRERGRDDGAGAGHGGANPQQTGGVRETGLQGGETSAARAILHIADLERVVAAARTQILANGQREVTLELHRSVLEGLRVRLTADGTGRVTAEFIAATEKMRAHIEARAADLSDLLRSRGVDLAALRTTVGADANRGGTGGDAQGQRGAPDSSAAVGNMSDARRNVSSSVAETSADEQTSDSGNSTYRA